MPGMTVASEGDLIDESYQPLAAKEFRFDSARGRYLAVDLNVFGDPNDPGIGSRYPEQWSVVGPLRFTDYSGDTPLNDLEAKLNSEADGFESILHRTRYFGLSGNQTLDPNEQPTDTACWHEDLIGSTSLTTDAGGAADVRIAYTAFGEVLTTGGIPGGEAPEGAPRYQYAGTYGYESDLLTLQGANTNLPPITLQHLGHRWYQPDIGRFVQRDPIGILGGINVCRYVSNHPVSRTDALGLFDKWEALKWGVGSALVFAATVTSPTWAAIGFVGCASALMAGLEPSDLQLPKLPKLPDIPPRFDNWEEYQNHPVWMGNDLLSVIGPPITGEWP